MSPVARSTATSSPKGGFWHGIRVSRFQKRAYGPYAEVRTYSAAPLLHVAPLADVHDVDKQEAEGRIDRHPAPVSAAEGARKKQSVAFERERRIGRTDRHPVTGKQLLAELRMLGRAVVQLFHSESVLRQRRRLNGERLGLCGRLSGDVRLRDGPLFDPVHRLSGDSIEHEQESHLGDLGDGRYDLTVAANLE